MSISHRADLMGTNSFSFCFSGNVLIAPSLLKNIATRYRISVGSISFQNFIHNSRRGASLMHTVLSKEQSRLREEVKMPRVCKICKSPLGPGAH